MENVTLGQIASVLAFVLALAGGVTGVVALIKKPFKKRDEDLKKYITTVIQIELQPLKDSINRIEADVKKTDKEACKNFLVSFLSNVDRGEPVDEIERQRFYEEWEHYESAGGNGYLHAKVARMKEKGLL